MKYGPAGGRQVASSFGQKFEAKSRLRVGCDGGSIMARVARVMPWVIAAAAVAADAPAQATAVRVAYIIGPDGRIKHVWAKATPKTFADEVLAHL